MESRPTQNQIFQKFFKASLEKIPDHKIPEPVFKQFEDRFQKDFKTNPEASPDNKDLMFKNLDLHKVTHENGDRSFLFRYKVTEKVGEDIVRIDDYITQVEYRDGKVIGYSVVRVPLFELDPNYSLVKVNPSYPYHHFIYTNPDFKVKGENLATRKLLLDNALCQTFYNTPLYTSRTLTSDGDLFIDSLKRKGLAREVAGEKFFEVIPPNTN